MVGRDGDGGAGNAEHLEGCFGSRTAGKGLRTADVDDRGAELEHRSGIDHHRHFLGNVERGAVFERLAGDGRADQIGRVSGIADDPDDLLAAGRSRIDLIHRGESRRDRPEGLGDCAVGPCRQAEFVHEHCLGNGGGLEPKGMGAARQSVAVAVELRAAGVHDCCGRRRHRRESQPEFVWTASAAPVAAVGDLEVELVVARARDGDEVFPRLQIEADE